MSRSIACRPAASNTVLTTLEVKPPMPMQQKTERTSLARLPKADFSAASVEDMG